ncbi:hypothetical protein C0J52_01184 [Blattella germanica]|nr:hypothetical protein C0J52_01184 [Blattella germanica]
MNMSDQCGHACKMELVNLDRLEVIEGAYNYVFNLWQRGHCDNCIKEFYNASSETYIPEVCQNCTDVYCSLNKYYDDLKESAQDGILCMDIVDTMNSTRTKWSKELGCSTAGLKAEAPLIVSVLLILTTPIRRDWVYNSIALQLAVPDCLGIHSTRKADKLVEAQAIVVSLTEYTTVLLK